MSTTVELQRAKEQRLTATRELLILAVGRHINVEAHAEAAVDTILSSGIVRDVDEVRSEALREVDTDRLRLAISDPGAFTKRRRDAELYEPLVSWQLRAVMHALTGAPTRERADLRMEPIGKLNEAVELRAAIEALCKKRDQFERLGMTQTDSYGMTSRAKAEALTWAIDVLPDDGAAALREVKADAFDQGCSHTTDPTSVVPCADNPYRDPAGEAGDGAL